MPPGTGASRRAGPFRAGSSCVGRITCSQSTLARAAPRELLPGFFGDLAARFDKRVPRQPAGQGCRTDDAGKPPVEGGDRDRGLRVEHRLQAIEHVVEGIGQVVELVVGAVEGEAAVELAIRRMYRRRLVLRAVGELYGDRASLADDVVVGRDQAIFGDDEPRAETLLWNGRSQEAVALLESSGRPLMQIAAELGIQAVELACQGARGEALPAYFGYAPRLVTRENVAEIAMQKLIAIAELPNRMVGVNRQQEQQRLAQLELGLEIHRRIGVILNRQQLAREIAELICAAYGYDTVQLLLWQPDENALVLEQAGGMRIPLGEDGVLEHALGQNELVFLPDTQRSQRFAPDRH